MCHFTWVNGPLLSLYSYTSLDEKHTQVICTLQVLKPDFYTGKPLKPAKHSKTNVIPPPFLTSPKFYCTFVNKTIQ